MGVRIVPTHLHASAEKLGQSPLECAQVPWQRTYPAFVCCRAGVAPDLVLTLSSRFQLWTSPQSVNADCVPAKSFAAPPHAELPMRGDEERQDVRWTNEAKKRKAIDFRFSSLASWEWQNPSSFRSLHQTRSAAPVAGSPVPPIRALIPMPRHPHGTRAGRHHPPSASPNVAVSIPAMVAGYPSVSGSRRSIRPLHHRWRRRHPHILRMGYPRGQTGAKKKDCGQKVQGGSA